MISKSEFISLSLPLTLAMVLFPRYGNPSRYHYSSLQYPSRRTVHHAAVLFIRQRGC
jgi:hypothetical protein